MYKVIIMCQMWKICRGHVSFPRSAFEMWYKYFEGHKPAYESYKQNDHTQIALLENQEQKQPDLRRAWACSWEKYNQT